MFGGRLTSTISAYHLTRQNVTVDDPSYPGFSIQTGEQRSQGVEVNAQARIVDGWDLLAFYAYTNGEITEDTTFAPGSQLANTPRHSGGLWTTWTFPRGPLKGLGAGAGFRYVGERPGGLLQRGHAAGLCRRGRLGLLPAREPLARPELQVHHERDVLQRQRQQLHLPGRALPGVRTVGWCF
jgi:outer membrane receptor protein involved in Fe transport